VRRDGLSGSKMAGTESPGGVFRTGLSIFASGIWKSLPTKRGFHDLRQACSACAPSPTNVEPCMVARRRGLRAASDCKIRSVRCLRHIVRPDGIGLVLAQRFLRPVHHIRLGDGLLVAVVMK
jgi:hypothetical protein